jgi:hypothetical protein
LKFETEFAKILRSLEQFIQTVKGQNNFWKQNAFLTCSCRFLISNKLEQLKFKLEKILGFRNMQDKLENNIPTYVKCGRKGQKLLLSDLLGAFSHVT